MWAQAAPFRGHDQETAFVESSADCLAQKKDERHPSHFLPLNVDLSLSFRESF